MTPFMLELASGEIVSVFAMLDEDDEPVEDMTKARLLCVWQENGKPAVLEMKPDWNLEKVARH